MTQHKTNTLCDLEVLFKIIQQAKAQEASPLPVPFLFYMNVRVNDMNVMASQPDYLNGLSWVNGSIARSGNLHFIVKGV